MLAYVTRLSDDPVKSAHGLQIDFVCKSFKKILNDQFIFLSFHHSNSFIVKASNFFFLFKKEIKFIYTRDIFLAFIFSFTSKKVFYEIHDEINPFAIFFIRYLKRLSSINIICISISLKEYCEFLTFKNIFYSPDACQYFNNNLPISFNISNVVLYTGSFKKFNIEEVLILAKNNYNYNFIFIGGDNDDIDYINQINNLPNVYFLKKMEYSIVRTLQKKASFLLYLNSYKNLTAKYTSPLKIYEYIEAETPIITTLFGAEKEIFSSDNAIIIKDINTFLIDRCGTPKNKITKRNWDQRAIEILGYIYGS